MLLDSLPSVVQTALIWAGIAALAYVITLWLALVFWTARDIRRRSSSPLTQVAAVLLVAVGFLPGHWLYLVARPRMTRDRRYLLALEDAVLERATQRAERCDGCGYPVKPEFVNCPACRFQLKQSCACSRPVDPRWRACPYCMRDLAPVAAPSPAQPAAATATVPAQPVPVANPGPAARPVPASVPVATITHERPEQPAPAPSIPTSDPAPSPALAAIPVDSVA